MNELPSREKYWEELTAEEKIERLACQVEYLKRIVDGVANVAHKMKNHAHVGGLIYFRDGPFSPIGWPNKNILSREK